MQVTACQASGTLGSFNESFIVQKVLKIKTCCFVYLHGETSAYNILKSQLPSCNSFCARTTKRKIYGFLTCFWVRVTLGSLNESFTIQKLKIETCCSIYFQGETLALNIL